MDTQKKMAGAVGKPQDRYPEHDDDGSVLIEKEGEVDKTEAVVDGKFQVNLTELLEYRRLNGESFRWCVCVCVAIVCDLHVWYIHILTVFVCSPLLLRSPPPRPRLPGAKGEQDWPLAERYARKVL